MCQVWVWISCHTEVCLCQQDVRELNSSFTNGMETFWVAETLKYFWLLFGPDDVLHWDSMILNTEVTCPIHPLTLPACPAQLLAFLEAHHMWPIGVWN